MYFVAPSMPAEVSVASNATDSVIIQWASPLVVFNRVDRYYIHYQAVDEPQSYERIVDDVNNSYDFYEVNSFFVIV